MDRVKLPEDVARVICGADSKARGNHWCHCAKYERDYTCADRLATADAAISAVLAGIRTCLDDCYATGADFEAIYAKFNAMIDHLIQENGKEAKGE